MKEMGVVLVVVGLLSLPHGGLSRVRRLPVGPILGWIALLGGVVLLARR